MADLKPDDAAADTPEEIIARGCSEIGSPCAITKDGRGRLRLRLLFHDAANQPYLSDEIRVTAPNCTLGEQSVLSVLAGITSAWTSEIRDKLTKGD
jgi:hypothetical protein